MIVVAFQIAFHAEIHVNDFFYFLKIIFDISTSKRFKKYKPHSILTKKNQNLTKHNTKYTLQLLIQNTEPHMCLPLPKKNQKQYAWKTLKLYAQFIIVIEVIF